ncbi:hypothetical protein [Rhizorhabdus histidinilytica]|uniref:hypothetical protein n=1 Tax=Rhizorhabdus histidinilytica TaxID=439228 RepID=UPI00321FAE51
MSLLTETDLAEIGAVLPRLYAAVGWSATKAPDWDVFRRCCHRQAVLVPMGSGAATPVPLDAFVAGMEGQRASGAIRSFDEVELGHRVEGYGNLASVRSSFVATIDGIDRRGVTFAHLVREEGRWLILAAAWENEREGAPLPADLI